MELHNICWDKILLRGKEMKLNSKILVGLVLLMWLVSEFGPEEATGAASICGIGVAVIALVRLLQEQKKNK